MSAAHIQRDALASKAAVTIKRNPADQGGRSSTTSRLGSLDLKSAPGSPESGLLESGVETKEPKLDHLELETSYFFEVSL